MEENIRIQLNEINRLINYDRSKTLVEQESIFTQQLYNPKYGTLSKADTAEKWYEEMDFENWTAHGALETAELVTGLMGMVPFPPLALVSNLASMGFGLANAGLYAYEGEYYDASIAAAFAMIPGPETVSMIKQIKNADGIATVGGKPVLNSKGKEVIEQGVLKNWKKALKSTLEETLRLKGEHWTFKYLVWLSRAVKNYYVKFAGIPIAFDTLYYLYTLTLKGDEQLTAQEARDKSEFKIIVDILKDPTEIINIMIDVFLNEVTEDDIANSEKYTDNAVDSIHAKSPDERERNNMKLANERGWKIPPKKD